MPISSGGTGWPIAAYHSRIASSTCSASVIGMAVGVRFRFFILHFLFGIVTGNWVIPSNVSGSQLR